MMRSCVHAISNRSSKWLDSSLAPVPERYDAPIHSSTQDFAGDPLLDEDYLTLSTIHSAKGLEWESVFVLHSADGNIPSDMATGSDVEIEEERRLFYVALTRAKSHLHVMHPQRYYFHNHAKSDRHSYSQRTRFIPDELLEWFEPFTVPRAMNDISGKDQATDVTTVDVRKRIGKMWA